MDILERLRKDCAGLKTSQLSALAAEIGIPSGTFIKIVNGTTGGPRYDTVKAIQAYYDRLPASLALSKMAAVQPSAGGIRRGQMG